MPLYLSGSNKTTALPPAGNHVARCFRAIDLGTQPDNYMGNDAHNRKLLVSFELPTLLHQFREERGMEPFFVTKEFTMSLGRKANLRKFLEGWRGRPFTDEEVAKFDVEKMVGASCLLNLIEHTSAAGNKSVKIVSAARLPQGMTCPPPFNPKQVLSLEAVDFKEDVLNDLPEWIRNKVTDSPEYRKIIGLQSSAPVADASGAFEDDDIPF